ncbi:tetratricopeptide repeat protein [Paenibacillus antri]|uniref:Tetratricopeptide repeat protein n=1 Tax=Paenibacillus antri TaxID=2582848 RepID=A0A5R9GBB6_9BACL|nr:AMP-binding protein [Paenibacillus antri]TLS50658.1 tetratricopeptide repeat protein [Paenibacillus antri]
MNDNHRERERKFQSLLQRLPKSPLYREKLSGIRLQGIGLNRIGTLPFTTKEELRAAGVFGHLAVDPKDVAQYHESTGTTGEPSASWFTREDLEVGGRQLTECGVNLTADDLVLIRFPYAMALPAFLMQAAAWQTGAGVVPASGRTVVTPYPRVLALMKRLRVTVLAGLPREMELLAETARLVGMDPIHDFPALRAICVAGELTGDKRKQHLEKLWGVPAFNLYGSTETGNIAAMCEFGTMHVVERDFYVETLREDGAAPVESGARGFAAVTTLSHQASPLLRYFNEDIVSIEPAACPCGRTGSKLVHYGRGKDRLRFGDLALDALDVQEAVYSLSPVPDAWQAVEREEGLHFLLDSHRSDEWALDEVSSRLSARLQVPVTVEAAALLDRGELTNNAPSTKPVYIRKLDRGAATTRPPVEPLQELLRLGRRALADGQYDRSREWLKKAVAVAPRSAEAHAWLAAAYGRMIETADMLEKMKLLPLLEEEIAAAFELDPSLPIARRVNGARLLYTPESLGGDPAAAADEFRYCIDRKMDEADVWASLGECYVKLGKTEQAVAALREALSRDKSHERANELLSELEREGSARHER